MSPIALAASAGPLAAHAWSQGGPPPFAPFFFFFLIPLFWALLIGAVVFALIRRRRHPASPHAFRDGWSGGGDGSWSRRPTDAAEAILAERFARGDVDEAEYRLRLEVLRATPTA